MNANLVRSSRLRNCANQRELVFRKRAISFRKLNSTVTSILSLVREWMEVRVELSFRNKIARFLKTSSHWFAQFRRRDAHTRFGCISPRLVIQSSATRFTGLTSNSISNLSKRVGPRSLNVSYSCRAMRFSRPSSRSKTNMNGRANCRQSSLGSSTILCRAPLRLPRSRMAGSPRRPPAPTLRSATGRLRSYLRNQRYFQFCGLPWASH